MKEGQNNFSKDMGIVDLIQAMVGIMEPVIKVGVAVKVVFKSAQDTKSNTLTAGLRPPQHLTNFRKNMTADFSYCLAQL
jgi:hypothetical protein